MPDLWVTPVGETHALDNGACKPHAIRMARIRDADNKRAAPPNARATTDLDRLIGSRIRQLRTAQRLSQEKLAELIGVTFQQIQKYERGVNRVSASTLYRIAQELRVPISDLLPGEAGAGLDVSTLRTLVSLVSDLNPAGRTLLINLARALTDCGSLRDRGSR